MKIISSKRASSDAILKYRTLHVNFNNSTTFLGLRFKMSWYNIWRMRVRSEASQIPRPWKVLGSGATKRTEYENLE